MLDTLERVGPTHQVDDTELDTHFRQSVGEGFHELPGHPGVWQNSNSKAASGHVEYYDGIYGDTRKPTNPRLAIHEPSAHFRGSLRGIIARSQTPSALGGESLMGAFGRGVWNVAKRIIRPNDNPAYYSLALFDVMRADNGRMRVAYELVRPGVRTNVKGELPYALFIEAVVRGGVFAHPDAATELGRAAEHLAVKLFGRQAMEGEDAVPTAEINKK